MSHTAFLWPHLAHGSLPFDEGKVEFLFGEEKPQFETRNWTLPVITAESNQQARPGYDSCKAHEYRDDAITLNEKIKILAKIIQKSKKFVVYSGAGLSTAAGIGDYASRADNSAGVQKTRPDMWSEFDVKPTCAHRIFTSLYNSGYLKHWIQQNHDGLPQKAGFPQHAINEIHGGWYDPANPVVQMSGALRDDYFANLLEWEEKTDFCLAVGTSLAGMNADRVANSAAKRFKKQQAGQFGCAIISIQQTKYDDRASLRLFCTIDEAMKLLAEELNIPIPEESLYKLEVDPKYILEEDVFIINHYDADGNKKDPSVGSPMILDLREDAKVRITIGQYKNCQGEITGKNKENHFRMRLYHPLKNNFMAPKVHTLGLWWIYAAINGTVDHIPIVNVAESLRYQ